MKKLLVLVLAIAMMLSAVAFAEEAAQPALQSDLYILFTSDVHCGIDSGFGYVGVDAIRNALVKKGYHVILVDNGDSIQGAPVGTMTTGEANIKLMNAMGYEVAIMGNHEFDYGMERFMELTKVAEFPYVSCNFNYKGETVFNPYVMKEYDGVKVAFVGVTTPKTLSTSTPKYFKENGEFVYGFCESEDGQKLYDAVQNAVDAARAEGANYVVLMGHLGNSADETPNYTYADVLANTTGIDLMLDGHSHDTESVSMQNKNGDTVLRQACGTKLEGVGYAVIATDGTLSTGLHIWNDKQSYADLFGVDSDITKAVEEATSELNAALATVVAHTPFDLIIKDPTTGDRIVRNSNCNLGDLCADAYLYASDADLAFVNGGGVRASISAGDITLNNILVVHPFGNSLCVCEATGQEILDALEWSAHAWPSENGGWLHVSKNVSFEIHTYLPSTCKADDAGMFVGVEGEYRVKNVTINGEPLQLDKVYTLACHNYKLLNMGDGYTMFADNVFLQKETMIDNQVLINYITNGMEGTVNSDYADPYGQGRIVFVEEAPAK